MKSKYYVVWKGREVGVFSSWEKCKKQIHNFEGAIYKSFKNKELAEKAFNSNYNDYIGKENFESELSEEQLILIGEPVLDSLSVDAACSGSSGSMEYRGVDTKTKRVIFHKKFEKGTNNIGEFLALVHALALFKKEEIKKPVYTDSKTAMSWVRKKKCKTKLEPDSKNVQLFDYIKRAEKWLEENSYETQILKWETKAWGEIPADFGKK